MGMTPCLSYGLAIAAVVLSSHAASAFEWETATPESQGLASAQLGKLVEGLKARGTTTFMLVRHDRVVCEWYAKGFSRDKPHHTASLAKAIVGSMSLMVALDDGLLAPDDLACKYVPAWPNDPLKAKITIRQLATHYSGIEDAEQDGLPHDKLPGWKGAFWRQDPNPFLTARDEAPVLWEPGTEAHYSNPGMGMLAYCVTAALQGTPEQDLRTLLTRRLMEPLGVPPGEWTMSYGKTYPLDGLPLCANWGGGGYSPNAVARLGRLMLHGGEWEGQQLVKRETIALMTADAGMPRPKDGEYTSRRAGLCWWLNSGGGMQRVPRDTFAGSGAGNQTLIVIPSLDLIVVRNGSQIAPKDHWQGVVDWLLDPLMTAITDPPYPPSHVIRAVDFAPVETIRREALGSDNWPITWGEDDALYTSYGDGWGFEPRTTEKLSLGLARVTGGPEDFKGANLRAPTAERIGDGPAGLKASGMLMVEGVLYMWVRNAGNSQLAWSRDHGRTWEWGFKFEESFGCPTFLNAGRNYGAAPDGYVYIYSSDGPSAYESYDQMVLARVPADRVGERGAYEFLAGVGQDGTPAWSADIARRQRVFRYPGHCQRSDVVYVPGLKRYLMALGFDHGGAWGLFDAPQPWGPWTTVFHTADWGLGDTHGYRLPAKWVSDDGVTLCLVFSGRTHEGTEYDAFCVRRMSLQLFPPAEEIGAP